jgi:hypothetical protein
LPLPHDSADIAFCDWGARASPIPTPAPEAARIPRPAACSPSTATPLLDVAGCWCDAPEARLMTDYFGLDRVVDDDETTEFQRTDGDWIRLFRRSGLRVEDLLELRPADAATSSYWDEAARAWARRWPAEQIWRLRREG